MCSAFTHRMHWPVEFIRLKCQVQMDFDQEAALVKVNVIEAWQSWQGSLKVQLS